MSRVAAVEKEWEKLAKAATLAEAAFGEFPTGNLVDLQVAPSSPFMFIITF